MTFRSLPSLTYLFVTILLAVTAADGVILYSSTHAKQVDLAKQRIASLSEVLVPEGEAIDPVVIRRRIALLSTRRDTGDLGMLLTDRENHVLAGNVRLHRNLPLGYSRLDAADGIPGLSHGRALVSDIGDGLRLTLIVETEPFDKFYVSRARLYLLCFGAILMVVGLGLIALRRMIGARISTMRLTAEAIIDGNLESRVPLNGSGDEFDQQAAGINRMLDRIAELMAETRNVTNEISHELRGPLTRLRGQLTDIAQQPKSEAVRPQMAAAIATTDEILAIFAALLRISEIESGRRRSGFTTVALDELIREQADMMLPVADEAGQHLRLGPCDPATIRGDSRLLIQLVVNLVENAIRHCPAGTTITLSLHNRHGCPVLTVEDNGPGIPPAEHKLVLRRFGQLDRSRSKAGYGLGMSLIEAIANLHDATLKLEDAIPGLRVVVEFR